MVRNWLWFIPIIPPTNAFIPAINITKCIFFRGSRNARIDKGASFCHVDKIKHETHEIEAITDGYQKWQGTLPNFSKIAVVRIMGIRSGREENDIHIDVFDINSMADPSAWARKYFTAPSVSWLFLVWSIIGINLRRLSSIAPHNRIQFALDKAIKVLINIDRDVSIMVGEINKVHEDYGGVEPPYKN